MTSQNQIRERVTRTLVEALEKGDLPPWRRPWSLDPNCGFPTSYATGKQYSGINVLLLACSEMRFGFTSKYFATYKQWEKLGGQVKRRPDNVPRGEWGTTIIYYSPRTKTVTDDSGEEKEESYFILKTFTVFNVDQVEGEHLNHLRAGHGGEPVSQIEGYAEAQRVIEATGADIREGGNRAFYRLDEDYIQVPHRSQCDIKDWYETVFHEVVHWSQFHLNTYGGNYAEEELAAEIGACFLAAHVGIPVSEDLSNHAQYLDHWLKAMKEDPKYIFRVAARASKAVDFILSFSREPEEALVV